MGFNSSDAQYLNQATAAGFKINSVSVSDFQHSVMQIVVTPESASASASLLANAVMSASRSGNHSDSSTVWIDVQLPSVPKVVLEALANCRGFGVGLVITCASASSHLPGPLLDGALIEMVEAASRGGQVWHPNQQCLVPA